MKIHYLKVLRLDSSRCSKSKLMCLDLWQFCFIGAWRMPYGSELVLLSSHNKSCALVLLFWSGELIRNPVDQTTFPDPEGSVCGILDFYDIDEFSASRVPPVCAVV